MTDHEREVVSAIRLAIAERIGNERFEVWFRTVRVDVDGSCVAVNATTDFALRWLRSNLRPEIEEACRSVIGSEARLEFRVAVTPPSAMANTSAGGERDALLAARPHDRKALTFHTAATRPSAPRGQGRGSRLGGSGDPAVRPASPAGSGQATAGSQRSLRRLEAFVPGHSNCLAYSSAEMVISALGSVSPLLLYGSTGVGKSHLAQGIWTAVREMPQNLRSVYLSAEQFTTYFLQALNGTGLPNFRRRYRQVDLLVIEDVQFFAGKKATIIELQHTLDAVLSEGRQVVLTADASPAELAGLGHELSNRLTGGLVIRVEPPDFEARREILRRESKRRGHSLPADVIDYMAEHLVGDARQLLGALHRLEVAARAWKAPIDLPFTESSLKDVVQNSGRALRLGDIERAVCGVFDLSPSHLKSDNKSRRVSHPRMLAMWLARKYTRAGLTEIGEYFGKRSHATVISAAKKVNAWVNQKASLRLTDQECQVRDAIERVERRLFG